MEVVPTLTLPAGGDLSLLPPAFLVAVAPYCVYKHTQRRVFSPGILGLQLLGKLAIACILVALQFQRRFATLAFEADTLPQSIALSESVVLAILIYFSHRHSPSPSLLLSLYLPLDVCLRARLLWLSAPDVPHHLAPLVLRVCLIVLHEQPKWSQIPELSRGHLQQHETFGFWNKALFVWVVPLPLQARVGDLTVDMLMNPSKESSSFALNQQFQRAWAKDGQRPHALLKIFIKTHWSLFIRGGFATLLGSTLKPSFALLIEHFTRMLESRHGTSQLSDHTSAELGQLALQTFFILFGLMVVRAYAAFADAEIKSRLSGMITLATFSKLLSLSDQSLSNFADFSLLRNDLATIQNSVRDIQDGITGVLSATVCAYLLWPCIGLNIIALIVVYLASVLFCAFVGEQMAASRRQWGRDSKVRAEESTKLVQSIKYAKMTGIINLTAMVLFRLQQTEAASRRIFMKHNTLRFMLVVSAHATTPIFAFGNGLFKSRMLGDIPILLKSVVLSFWFAEDLKLVLQIPEIWSTAVSSFSTVEDLLRTTAHQSNVTVAPPLQQHQLNRSSVAVEFKNVSLAPAADRAVVLSNISASIPRGTICVLTGKSGSGKTLFARAVIGRAHKTQGAITVEDSSIAYCGQDEWLLNESVRHNIIGDNAFDDTWYTSVVTACVLTEDIECLENRDDFVVSSLGANIEPSFRQRLALARAVYSRAPLLILDDILSGQNPTVARLIVAQLLSSNGLLRKGTTVLITALFPEPFSHVCHQILHINDHRYIRRLALHDASLQRRQRRQQNSDNADQDQSRNTHLVALEENAPESIVSQLQGLSTVNPNYQRISYSVYIRRLGPLTFAAWLFVLFFATLLEGIPFIYLRFWLDPTTTTNFPFWRCVAFTICSGPAFAASGYLFHLILAPKAAATLHDRLLETITGSTLTALNPANLKLATTLLNDGINTASRELPTAVFQTGYSFMTTLAIILIMGSIHSSALLMAATITFSLFCIRSLYCYTAQKLKDLHRRTTDSLCSQFAETVTGVPYLCCLRGQRQHLQRVRKAIKNTQIVSYNIDSLEAWMKMMTDLTMTILVTAFIYILGHADVHPHLVGLVLSLFIYSIQHLSTAIKHWHGLDMAMLDVQQIEEFITNTPQMVAEQQKPALPDRWPSQGLVEFEDVSIAYNTAGNSPVITNATFKLEGVQKAAIYGPRQSGKTTLILSMILLLPYEGSIKIDGVEARDIPRDKFKQIFTIIPESPVTFQSASIRQNLLTDEIIDPTRADAPLNPDGIRFLFDDDMDERLTLITKVLHGVGLSDIVRDSGGVDAKFSNLVLSPTQRQKFSLAQGLAKHYATRTKMAIIDSATSHVNTEGLERMNSLIDEILGVDPDCMVITLASHSDAIDGSEYVARIAGGRVTKFFVESMLRKTVSSSKNRVSKRVSKSRAIPSDEELASEVARRSGQGMRDRGRRPRSPSPATLLSSHSQLTSDAGAGPSTSQALPPRRMSPLSFRSPSTSASGTHLASRSPGSGRNLRPTPASHSPVSQRPEPARRRRVRTIRPPPVVRPRSPSISDDSDDDTLPEIPGWMVDFADDSISELRRHELYTRIFEYGSARMERLLLRHALRDNAILQHFHELHHSDEPHILQQQVRDIQTVTGFYHKLQSALVVARYARQQGRC
ncbi:hypothetical protein VHEMI07985 [[Torrubiella] hemipterigena]|uniref:ABC transporter n=1 Tax=[Torrubiella] hemipterigena TaxID=1531966 RepID=A0A0A1TMD6_9HYPO|nr:hypothetical protein VHEMI07985 [[Torrubiella] hemipterigena]